MYKLALFLSFLILIFNTTSGQRTELNVLAGLSTAIMREDGDKSSFARHYGAHVGLLFATGSEHVLFSTGLLYSARGTAFVNTVNFGGGVNYSELKMSFIDIPAMIVVSPSSFRFFIGPQLSFLQTVSFEGDKMSSADVNANFNKTTVGLRYGIGVTTPSGFIIQLHFINGLSDLYKHPTRKWINNGYQFAIGYRLFGQLTPKKKDDGVVPSHRVLD